MQKIIGAWELLDVCAVSMLDCPPFGFCALKYVFEDDGFWFALKHDEKCSESTPKLRFTNEDKKFTIHTPEGDRDVPYHFEASILCLEMGDQVWRFRKLEGKQAHDQPIEPRSVIVMQADPQLTSFDVNYESLDRSQEKITERIQGVWEANHYDQIPRTELPPYGFPNNRWIIDDHKITVLAPGEKLEEAPFTKYQWVGSSTVESEMGQHEVAFNQWGHLILKQGEPSISFKCLSKNPSKIEAIPTKPVLVTLAP